MTRAATSSAVFEVSVSNHGFSIALEHIHGMAESGKFVGQLLGERGRRIPSMMTVIGVKDVRKCEKGRGETKYR
jgi:hypothetical protein